jgi:hypothetical protein
MFALAGGMSADVSAVCAQANLTGTWYAVGVSGNVRTRAFDTYMRCKVVLSSLGAVVPSLSSCIGRDDVGRFIATVSAGTVRVSPACAITGTLTFNAGGAVRSTIEFGQMSTDKNIFTFTLYQNSDPDVLGSFTAVKR